MQPAFVLHRRPFTDSSLLVECFIREEGRLPLIAKGALGRSKRRAALLQPFNPILIGWSGRGEVKTLSSIDSEAAAIPLKGERLYCGFYLNELLMRLLMRNDPHEALFDLYALTLRQLADTGDTEPLLRSFELQFLDQLGYGLVLDQDVDNDLPLMADGYYHYQFEKGPVAAAADAKGVVRGSTLLSLRSPWQLDAQGLREARDLMRRILNHYLGDRPLKSRELFQTLFNGHRGHSER